jgi:RND family efflux transporter MFP subunit
MSTMRKWITLAAFASALGFISLLTTGCERPAVKADKVDPPIVIFDYPKMQKVIDFEEFTGRTEAIESVEIRSRVTGYLQGVHFQDGEEVTKNKLLFTIDDRLFKAELERASANVNLEEAKLNRIRREYDRIAKLRATNAVSEDEYDRIEAEKFQSEASLGVAKAQQKTAAQNLDYTKITAPIDGRMSRRFADVGNLVRMDETALSLLLRLNPMYVYFDVDDRTYLVIRRAIAEKTLLFDDKGATSISIGLPDEDGYSLTGKVNFIDNKVDAGTGTLRLRATVENPKGIVTAGLFVRVRLPISEEVNSMLVPEVAIGTNQGLKYVYALNDENKVVERRVRKIGKQHSGNRVLLDSDVLLTDRIIVSGGQRVRVTSLTTPKPYEAPKKPKPATTPTTSTTGNPTPAGSGS